MICEDRYKLTQLVAMSSSCRNVMTVGDGNTVEGQKVWEEGWVGGASQGGKLLLSSYGWWSLIGWATSEPRAGLPARSPLRATHQWDIHLA